METKPSVPKVKPTPVCLTDRLLRELDAEAEREGLFRGRSIIIRRACEQYLRRTNPKQDEVSASGGLR